MKKLMLSMGGAAAVALLIAATALAAGPNGGQGPQGARNGAAGAAGTMIPAMLGLTPTEVQELRQSGLSLAQIAERQDVDPETLVDALAARWTARIEARVAAGALSADEATALRAQVELRARDMVNKVPLGGMQGQAVGAGAGRQDGTGGGRGNANGSGNMHGAGRGSFAGDGSGAAGRGAGNGTCDGSGRGAGQ